MLRMSKLTDYGTMVLAQLAASDQGWTTAHEVAAATHLARLVPQHMMRTLYFTAQNITAQQLVHFGSCYKAVPREELLETALEVARLIDAKDTRVIRAAKAAINGIDPVDVKTSYLLEQRYTYELNLAGVADEHRDAFVETGKTLKENK